jgi:hypothetical protein
MKRFLIMVLASWLLSGPCTANAAPLETCAYDAQSTSDKKAERQYRKEQRKARRAEYRAKHGQSDYARMTRENNKQRKRMDQASRKENRKRWDTNELGDVYGIH